MKKTKKDTRNRGLSAHVNIVVTEDDKQWLDSKAEELSLPVGAVLRMALKTYKESNE